jgi:hypothetical protein
MKQNTLQTNQNIQITQKHLLASLSLLSKDLLKSDPIITGISLPMILEFYEFYEILLNDQHFREKLNLFSVNKTRIIHVIENYEEKITKFEGPIYSNNFDLSSPVIIEVITITYQDLINNKQIIEILSSEEFNQNLFFFEDCTWLKIKNILSTNNISLTVGANTRRQFLSPIEYKFSLFLMCLGLSLEDITKTFLNYEQYDKHQQKLVIKKQKIEKRIEQNKQKRLVTKRFDIKKKNLHLTILKLGSIRHFSTLNKL